MPPVRPKVKTIGMVGSRRRDTLLDYHLCEEAFFKVYNKGDRIVSGGCPKGGDRFAEIIAKRYGITIVIHYADWNGPDGKRAGFVRNSDIAQECDVLLALVALDRTGGTEDTIKKAVALGKQIILL